MYKSLTSVYLNETLKRTVPRPWTGIANTVCLNEATTGSSYDDIIINSFNDEKDELKEQLYKIEGIDIGTPHINPKDVAVWKKLYNLAPPRLGKKEGQTKGSGNGELALYWFLNKKSHNKVYDNRFEKSGSADLVMGDVGMEVKSYDKSSEIKVGKFKSSGKNAKQNNLVLSSVFGMDALLSKLSFESDKKSSAIADMGNFNYSKLVDGFFKMNSIYTAVSDPVLRSTFPVFEYIYSNIDKIYKFIGSDDPKICALQTLLNLTLDKLSLKPGNNGYIINVNEDGSSIEWLHVNVDNIQSNFQENSARVKSGELFIDKKLLLK
jgi:hypothetical protein